MMKMRLRAEFFTPMEERQEPTANDNRMGDEDFIVRNIVTAELTRALAMFSRNGGTP